MKTVYCNEKIAVTKAGILSVVKEAQGHNECANNPQIKATRIHICKYRKIDLRSMIIALMLTCLGFLSYIEH